MNTSHDSQHAGRERKARTTVSPAGTDAWHAYIVDEYSAATLRTDTGVPSALAAAAATERVTNSEWLRSRTHSRIGVADNEAQARSLQRVADTIRQKPLFQKSLADGATWDW